MKLNERSKNIVPRTLDKALRIPRTAKDASRHIRNATDDIQEKRDETPTQFAVNTIEQRGKEAAQKGAQEVLSAGKNGVKEGLERGKEAFRRSTDDGPTKAHKPNDGQVAREARPQAQMRNAPQAQPQAQSSNVSRTQEQVRFQAREQGRARYKSENVRRTGVERAKSAEQVSMRTRQGLQSLQDVQRAGNRSFSFVNDSRRAANNTTNTARRVSQGGQRANRTVKTASKSVKTASRSVKTSTRAIKTAKQAAQTAAKAAKAAQKTAAAAKQLAVKAAKATAAAVKATVKVTIAAVKAFIAAIQALISAIVAGGWVVVVILLVIVIVAAILISPIGIFYSGDTGEGRPMPEIITEIRGDLRARIEEIKAENAADAVVIDYEGDDMISNWRDVIAVFAVKTATDPENGVDVLILDEDKVARLEEVFWDMNNLSYSLTTSERVEQSLNPDGATNTEVVTITTLIITITSKNANQMSTEYGFTPQQKEMLDTLLSAEFRPMMTALLGLGEGGMSYLTPEQLEQIFNDLPTGTIGGDIVKFALEYLGDPYSERDCSQFVRYCYAQFNISLPRTAAEQGQYCYQNDLTISPDDLVPGDLIFFSHDSNGRFLDITHVAIYAGNGMVVDSSSSRGEVVYRQLYSGAVLWGRPHIQ